MNRRTFLAAAIGGGALRQQPQVYYSGANSGPNGICFSPDYKKVYIADTGGGREVKVWDIDGKSIRNGKRFVQLDIPGTG
ncbi:MAG TPA: hypothetical protein VGK48_00605 [Terriglobia bacterium]|jgi:sugar lactone lactonase YvrE